MAGLPAKAHQKQATCTTILEQAMSTDMLVIVMVMVLAMVVVIFSTRLGT
jgi:hypothetical protein